MGRRLGNMTACLWLWVTHHPIPGEFANCHRFTQKVETLRRGVENAVEYFGLDSDVPSPSSFFVRNGIVCYPLIGNYKCVCRNIRPYTQVGTSPYSYRVWSEPPPSLSSPSGREWESLQDENTNGSKISIGGWTEGRKKRAFLRPFV